MRGTSEIEYAISVRQPWAWAIIHGGKDVENRSEQAAATMKGRALGHRIYIHAGKSMTRVDYEWAAEFMAKLGVSCPPKEELELGGFIGSVQVVDIVNKSRSPWFARGGMGLALRDPEPCAFVPARGQLGLFDANKAILG
ncbi:MAG: hypothetical protein ACLPN5_04945 [Roseiarcus sp.]